MFYEDLSPYSYASEESFSDLSTGMRFVSFRPGYERINVGWLAAVHPWMAGSPPTGFTDKLLAILEAQAVNQVLGLHDCDLCPPMPAGEEPPRTPRLGDRVSSVGTGEIRVPGAPGSAFAAPALIGHYVADHGYLPPQPFIDAVFAFDIEEVASATFPWIKFPWIPDDADLYDARTE